MSENNVNSQVSHAVFEAQELFEINGSEDNHDTKVYSEGPNEYDISPMQN